jgi:hypothetical protein
VGPPMSIARALLLRGYVRMWIMVAGPYRSNSSDPVVWAKNLEQLNRTAHAIFRKGHVPIVGVNLALPIVTSAGEGSYDTIMMPLSLSLTERCDAILRIEGISRGADQEVERFRARGLPVFRSLDEIPALDQQIPRSRDP